MMEARKPPDESHPKRKMKTPSQLEILERVYAEDKYPSEIVRSELSAQLNLTDRQVKMWFCHRRLKDRKVNNEEPPASKKQKRGDEQQQQQYQLLPPHPSLSLEVGGPSIGMQQPMPMPMPIMPMAMAVPMPMPQQQQQHNFLEMMHPEERAFHMRQLGREGSAHRKLGLHMLEATSALRAGMSAEVAAIRLVEEQLGEPLREDGPMLGYQFDPLPPGAFDTPIEHGSQWKRQYERAEGLYSDSKLHGRHESKLSRTLASEFSPSPTGSSTKRKTSPFLPSIPITTVPQSPRVLHEHQFIPEHPTGPQFYERNATHPKLENRLELGPSSKIGSLPSFLPAAETFAGGNGYCSESRAPSLGLNFSPADIRTNNMFPGGEFGTLQRRDSLGAGFPQEVPLLPAVRPPMSEKALAGCERLMMLHEQEQARLEKKRKAEEARVAKELEAQEKRFRKEVERQEIMRRKKEEQERKELEKLNREKQKELERIIRERAREEERIQRQHRKEYERMEKMMQKEHQRVEKLRQKEELRREKEATKLRAAYERATAKKLAKLSTGLMDDEQLELMQLGAFVQGLVSGSGFDPSKVELTKFPPASVRMKLPIAVPPWIDSEQNVANLFMVWRMLTTFADVIGLWPFTLDEFVQALHDYDSRLLGEIHIALLKTLVKDVQDASQAAASGSNQAIAIAAGGHPELVEAAYSWGFDIQEWGQHLNPLTWPEILRQFALASGFGPKWKKRISESTSAPVFNSAEGKNAEDAVATLRSGAAAANAVTQMRGKSGSRLRKSQQKLTLTPGTVKYAAFHVLSVEGSKGLTILEIVDRVQKAGLRDLSTSKTPEASISAVLSRDTKLFERVAPSTYCVRAIYRKTAEDAEEILEAAREKIRLYESRLVDAEALEEEIEEVDEREEEEEDQEIEEPETETRENTEPSAGKVILRLKEGKIIQVPGSSAVQQPTESADASKADTAGISNIDINLENAVAEEDRGDGMEIDESQVGEVWVQGLMEGEYTDLSVEERLNGLVALVDAVNQGNAVRSAIEERYEAASALKRQLWEEVQLDKRRLKEELVKGDAAKAEEPHEEKSLFPVQPENGAVQDDILPEDANSAERRLDLQRGLQSDRSRAQMKADIRLRAEKLYVIRSLPLGLDRRHNRYWQFVTGNGGQDPGCGRIYFESHADGHWEVIDSEEALNALMNSLDTRGAREAHLFMALKEWEDSLRQAMGARAKQCSGNDSSDGSPSSAVLGGGKELLEVPGSIMVELGTSAAAIERYKDMEKWLWNQCLGKDSKVKALRFGKQRDADTMVECELCHDLHWPNEKHCPFCHSTTEFCENEADYTQHVQDCEEKMKSEDLGWKLQGAARMLPPRIQVLKKMLFFVEISIPIEAFKGVWTPSYRTAWCNRLKVVSAAGEVLQAFTDLEGAIHQDWISSSYETTEQIGSLIGNQRRIPPWIPQTTAAVTLGVLVFDAAVAYSIEQKHQLLERQHKNREKVRVKFVQQGLDRVPSQEDGREANGLSGKDVVKAAFNSQDELPSRFYDDEFGVEDDTQKENMSKAEAESDDSSQLNWDGQDSFEEQQENGNHMEDGMAEESDDQQVEDDDEERHGASSDADDNSEEEEVLAEAAPDFDETDEEDSG